ncbi:MAG TPA: GTPase HflX [Acidimicrobiia bacterium]|nr:GTPase HflX [Acidimicrobiia bacterium]
MALIDRTFRERIVLVGTAVSPVTLEDVDANLDELALLVDTAGADALARVVQRMDHPDPALFLGKGKAEELHQVCLAVDADTVVFDEELTPAQQRNLEKLLGRTAIDRTAVILDIFAQHAHTQQGKVQVELAQLRYRLPRLRGRQLALSQQRGGVSAGGAIGNRGPGETQLEVDRRRLLRRITKLEHELINLRRTRTTELRSRRRSRLPAVTLVGYTNAGKSTLLNRLTAAGVLVEDRLFSTLDPTTRRLALPGGETVLLSDTVGFVRKLPHQLVEAFRSTLDEVASADLLIHVVDGSSSSADAQIDAVRVVLDEIGAGDVPTLVVYNKADVRVPDRLEPGSVVISARTGAGTDALLTTLSDRLRTLNRIVEFRVPYARGDVLAALHRAGEILVESHEEDATVIRARLDQADAARFGEFCVS